MKNSMILLLIILGFTGKPGIATENPDSDQKARELTAEDKLIRESMKDERIQMESLMKAQREELSGVAPDDKISAKKIQLKYEDLFRKIHLQNKSALRAKLEKRVANSPKAKRQAQ